ncbi:hypothetical protein Hdeb2414_s0007g00250691 [Helianthus debilis subsp. tardiflorus]
MVFFFEKTVLRRKRRVTRRKIGAESRRISRKQKVMHKKTKLSACKNCLTQAWVFGAAFVWARHEFNQIPAQKLSFANTLSPARG